MDFSQFSQKIQSILDAELPSGASVVREGRGIAEDIEIGRTAFMDKMGVTSELEYKRQCIKNGHIMYHAHIGMNTWEDTAAALTHLYRVAEESCFVVDRAGLCLDRRMALPRNNRDQVPAETGPMLETDEQWLQVGREVPGLFIEAQGQFKRVQHTGNTAVVFPDQGRTIIETDGGFPNRTEIFDAQSQ